MSFAEESCWNGEDFRHVRKAVVFKVYSIGKNLGEPFSQEFQSDYGLWWDQDDVVLVWHLSQVAPQVNWANMVFHKKIDHSAIDIYDPETDRMIARVEVRRFSGAKKSLLDGDLGPTVVRLSDWRRRRQESCPVD